MQPTLTINYATGSYPIYIESGALQRAGQTLEELLPASHQHALITDQNVSELYLPALRKITPDVDFLVHVCPPGEQSKSLQRFEKILNELLQAGLDRGSTVVALGGGVPGDLAGFVAASYMRGIKFVQVPTTLLAQVDSSVGGKTGLNLPAGKNSVGAFWQPHAVLIDPMVLKTLDDREYTSGLAEVVKYGVIMDEPFFAFLEQNTNAINQRDTAILETVIKRCCELKGQVVAEDEREVSGRRMILNYGHTFGHAIESVFGYGEFAHGHAVAMGMHAAAVTAKSKNLVDDAFVQRQAALLQSLKIPFSFPKSKHTEMLQAMKLDKKASAGKLRLILPTSMGNVQLFDDVTDQSVIQQMELAAA